MTRILVTGGGGFIGAHLRERLEHEGFEVLAPNRSELNVRDMDSVSTFFASANPEWVFHLAADLGTGSEEDIIDLNIGGTRNMLAAAALGNVRAFVTSGSFLEYGIAEVPFTESTDPQPFNAYGRSKLEATRLVLASTAPAAVARLSNVYGPGGRDYVQQLRGAIQSNSTVRVSREIERDYIYVADVAKALLLIAGRIDVCAGEILNICTGEAYTTDDIASRAERIAGVPEGSLRSAETYLPTAPYQRSNRGSYEKARSLIGWAPEYDIERGLRATLLL